MSATGYPVTGDPEIEGCVFGKLLSLTRALELAISQLYRSRSFASGGRRSPAGHADDLTQSPKPQKSL